MAPWEAKAHKIIAKYALAAYLAANTTKGGKRRTKHVPYTLPEIAAALVAALGLHDAQAREHEIKRLLEVERLGAWSLVKPIKWGRGWHRASIA